MTVKTHKLLALCVASAALSLAVLSNAPAAGAASPWWHLSLGQAPASVQPGSARDEVQEITAQPRTAFELKVGGHEVGLFEVEPYPFGGSFQQASAANVQAALETAYGAGNVIVSGGPGGIAPLTVTSTGKDADQSVAPIEIGVSIGGNDEARILTGGRADGQLVLTASNLGDADLNATSTPVSIADALPPGLKAVAIEGFSEEFIVGIHLPLECELASLSCKFTGIIDPYWQIEVRVSVVAEAGAVSGGAQEASVSGGGLPSISATRPVSVGGPVQFGAEDYEMSPEEEGGGVDAQAGSHPFQLTTTLMLNQTSEVHRPPALAKDLHFKLPAGLIGNPTPFPRCTDSQFFTIRNFLDFCPDKTAIGVADVTVFVPSITREVTTETVPLFNLEPNVGEPARFGFEILGAPVILDTSVRTGEDYGVTVTVDNIVETATFLGSRVTFWGVPGDPRHENSRGWDCIDDGHFGREAAELPGTLPSDVSPCAPLHETDPAPFLALPTSCTGPLQTSVETDSWQQKGVFGTTTSPFPGLDGCNRLPFTPSISVAPDGQAGSTPSGLTVGVHVPQAVSLDPEGLSEADVRNTTVTLPPGVTLNPAAADGLSACSVEQVDLPSDSEAACPEASKVATVEIKSPLLPNPLVGEAYLAAQNANPFGSLVALYLVAKDPVSGTLVKLAGQVVPDPLTGQLVSTFENTPQLPFEDLKLHFFGGDRAPLSTPALCGPYTTTASIAPWSGLAPARPSSTFEILSGPNASACQNPLPFSPYLTSGTTSIQAGGFSTFSTTFSREDGQQPLQGLRLHMPPGLSGLLSKVKLCGEQQADEGSCGPESQIGETIVSVGLGGDPFSVKGGRVYITGPYEGAPFGLSIVNPAKAGPYDLGKGPCDCVLVRAKIEVDPQTAALTVTTDDSGPYKIPTILDGIPLQIKHVNVTINREHFTFNPTNCNPLQITGAIQSTEGASSNVAVPFQVTNCAILGFKPGFKVSTSGKTSRSNGASLSVKLTYPAGSLGTQANIKSVKVDLPKQLPSRLTTLQKACTSSQFEANPAGCPPESIVGHATAITPLIPVPLSGPAYFVSYAGLKFPELIVALQGYGVSLDLHGETFINKAGVTSSTFRTVPDAPVGSFELNLPEGHYSALAANGNLCTAKLVMPTAFTAQNGATIKQSTPIAVTGCIKKKATKHRKGSKSHGKK